MIADEEDRRKQRIIITAKCEEFCRKNENESGEIMKIIIVYSSQTGFTKRYANWLAEELGADVITLADAKKRDSRYFDDADGIIYGGWAMGEMISHSYDIADKKFIMPIVRYFRG